MLVEGMAVLFCFGVQRRAMTTTVFSPNSRTCLLY